jgi:hypothetical protein
MRSIAIASIKFTSARGRPLANTAFFAQQLTLIPTLYCRLKLLLFALRLALGFVRMCLSALV